MTGAYDITRIRNFAIIAHIDHGKSTLADRLLELTETVSRRDMKEQLLDTMDLERERGITIKLQACRMNYVALSGQHYMLNLIDTPGHVDFNYEVSRSLAACEGCLLLVDASQGLQAQTIANLYLALEQDLEIIPVINKIDLPAAQPDVVADEIVGLLGCMKEEILQVSAKEGTGARELLEAVVERIPHPTGNVDDPLRALIFDSKYDAYVGAQAYIRLVDGRLKRGDRVRMMATRADYDITQVGVFTPKQKVVDELKAGEVGYFAAQIKQTSDTRVGDTVTHTARPAEKMLAGYKRVKPMVYCGIFPTEHDDYEKLRFSLEKLTLNDSALHFEPENSHALGFGFRCGFLGVLHMEIVQERIEREFDIDIVATYPNVVYRVKTNDGELKEIASPQDLPEDNDREYVEEPIARVSVVVPKEWVGNIMEVCHNKRAEHLGMEYLGMDRVSLNYLIPLNEIIIDFHDRIKAVSKGYGSYDYEFEKFVQSKLVKVDILLNKEKVDALSYICHEEGAYRKSKEIVERLKKEIPRHMFDIPIQASIGTRIIARETIRAMRKDVTAKCYGGDISRKRKLLEKQKAGKKRMKQVGSVTVPQEAFLAVLKLGDDK